MVTEELVIEISSCYDDSFIGYLSKDAEYKQYLVTENKEDAMVFTEESTADLWHCKLRLPPASLSCVNAK